MNTLCNTSLKFNKFYRESGISKTYFMHYLPKNTTPYLEPHLNINGKSIQNSDNVKLLEIVLVPNRNPLKTPLTC